MGTRAWCGYSFGWAACIYAKAKQADSAVNQLRIFASNFCSTNSFHLNGDQKGGQYSSFTYRPFTLEGNFAFAQGVHELLLQSNKGYIEIFPAVLKDWKDVSFNDLRAEGAYVVSAVKENGVITQVKIKAEKDGQLKIKRPFPTYLSEGIDRSAISMAEGNLMVMNVKKGQVVTLKNAFE
jgi:alpha-L-fucosidase 2